MTSSIKNIYYYVLVLGYKIEIIQIYPSGIIGFHLFDPKMPTVISKSQTSKFVYVSPDPDVYVNGWASSWQNLKY